jgi:hypothetical protein
MRSRNADQKPCGVCSDAADFTAAVVRALEPGWHDERAAGVVHALGAPSAAAV